ncbi:E3 ubiquitin-protein ligase Mdm2-like [Oncorhynchus clarkii lewisi]|uniref:E3 ubiquitin-protein ligase Mdm2-like n=1 Tax=Oncorhynchus clarkii lewisi TaxID=490388 RepID=UPI0039B98849
MAENCERMSEGHRSSSQINTLDNEKLVRPKEKLCVLLQQAGADKDVFTLKEVFDGALHLVLFAMITQNLLAVKNQESQSVFTEPRSQSEPDRGPKGFSFSLTFDDSMSWYVIGDLRRDWRSSESSDSHSNAEVGSLVSDACDDVLSQDLGSDSDNFSVEFEVESIDSDAYSDPEEASVSGEDEVSVPDYWKCSKCDELNPPLLRNCIRCWTLRMDWFPDSDSNSAAPNLKPLPPKPTPATTAPDETEGLDVPDGKRARSPLPLLKDSQELMSVSGPDSQDSACSSQPSTSSSNSNGVGSGSSSSAPFSQQVMAPDLERFSSLEAHLSASCLEPCVICQTRPKNGCIVHGRTGHLMACYTCARKLKKRNKLCPVCREPIQSVVLIYLS